MRAAPRRVLMTADAVGGVFSYAVDLARVLSEAGAELLLVVIGPAPSPEQRSQLKSLSGVQLLHRPGRLEWMDDPWSDVDEIGRWLLALEASYKPDVVHLNGYAYGALPFAAPTVVVAHSCVLSWWQAVKGTSAPAAYDRYRERVQEGLRRADMVVAPSREMLRMLQHHYGRTARGQVIYNGHHAGSFAPGPKQPRIAAAGRVWDEAKNLHVLERIAPQVPWPLCVAGQAHAPTHEPAHEREQTCVRWLGQLSQQQLAEQLAHSAIFVSPARYEPFGLSILEAAAAGCALVLADIPTLRELWEDAAVFVSPHDEPQLVAALRLLIEEEPLRCSLAEAARTRAGRYSFARFGHAYLELYASLCVTRRAHASVSAL